MAGSSASETHSNSTPESDDEHQMPNQSISSSNGPKSPNNEAEEREELEQILRDLEEENATLQAEYDRLKNKQTPTSTPDADAQATTQGPGQGQVVSQIKLKCNSFAYFLLKTVIKYDHLHSHLVKFFTETFSILYLV